MNSFWAVFLGVLQGFTEFLPVSSSGHLVIAQSLIPNFSQPGVLFDVVLHAGTLFAVVVFFRKEILKMNTKEITYLAIGTIPVAFLGYFFQSSIEGLFKSIRLVGAALLITGIVNLLTNRTKPQKKALKVKSSFLVGLAQAFAIIPGISRSGLTIFAGVTQGISRKKAAQFSFLLSAPAVLGANILQIATHAFEPGVEFVYYFAGFLAAFVSGIFAIGVVLKLLFSKRFNLFGYYCILLGVLILFLS